MPSENFSIEYAYVSQRGYYPEAPNKTNQDTYCVQTEFKGNPNSHLFGVFDGHGTQGTACSIFARDKVCAWALSHTRRAPLAAYLLDATSFWKWPVFPASWFQNAVAVASRMQKPTHGASGRR